MCNFPSNIIKVIILGAVILLNGCGGDGSSDSGASGATSTINLVDGNSLYIPTTGVVSVTLSASNADAISSIHVSGGLPSGVRATNCQAVSASSCTFLIIAENATAGNATLTIAGDHTNTLSPTLTVETPEVTYSSLTLTGPGNTTITVTNPTHFPITLSSVALSSTSYGVTIGTNNCTGTLAAQSTCTVILAADNASYIPSNASLTLTVSGTISTQASVSRNISESVSFSTPGIVTLGSASATFNNGQNVSLYAQDGSSTLVSVVVGASSFSLRNPVISISSSNSSKIAISACSSIMAPGTTCNASLLNLDNLDPNGDGTITLSADNLSQPITYNLDVIGGIGIRAEPISITGFYPDVINGPRYLVIGIENLYPLNTATINTLITTLTGSNMQVIDPSSLSGAYGNYQQCTQGMTLAAYSTSGTNDTCLIVLYGTPSDPSAAALTGTLQAAVTPSGGAGPQVSKTLTISNTTYLYSSGAYYNLGSATSGGTNGLFAKCNHGTCQNYFGDTTSGWSPKSSSAAQSGMLFAVDKLGNLYVGGNFKTLGTATAGSNYLLAKCRYNSCENYFGATSTAGADNTMNNILIDSQNQLYVMGSFTTLGTATAGSNTLLAKCSGGTCQNYFGNATSGGSGTFAGAALDSSNNLYLMVSGGSLNGVSTSASYLFAKCTAGTCQNYFGSDATTQGADGITRTIVVDTSGNIYVGGFSSNIGTATAGSNKLLAKCSAGICQNFFGAGDTTSGGNSFSLAPLALDSSGNLYVSAFNTLGTATAGSNDLLAKCSGSSCQNFFGVSDTTSGANNFGVTFGVIDSSNNLYVDGSFSSIGSADTGSTAVRMLAKCSASSNTCQNFLSNSSSGADQNLLYLTISNELTAQ